MIFRSKLLLSVLSILILQFLGGCVKLPDNSLSKSSYVITDGESTSLGKAFKPEIKQHPGESGIILLGNGLDAFVGRAVLANLAEKSIDVQYYMFHQDTVGSLLIRQLIAAADRGVRVRMLIDDMYGEDGDEVWSALDTHSQIEVRLYNPFVRGYSKNMQLITQVKRVNHRMHSKSYTVDNQVTIVGGRNIGDEYFDADKDVAFSDLDAMTIGSVAPEVSSEFDQYWNNRHSYPISTLLAGTDENDVASGSLDKLRRQLDEFYQQDETLSYRDAMKNSALANSLRNRSAQFSFSRAKIIHDSAEKMTHSDDNWKDELLMSQLAPYIQQAKKEYILVSPYFVPGKKGADAICKLCEQGVRVRILTNSLVSNDVMAVHVGYMRHRKQLLRCGVELYELNEQLKKVETKRFTWLPGVSKSSLHAKTMSMDDTIMFVGSFNFDQRSLNINTEMGIVFEDKNTATNSSERFDSFIDKVAFRVELAADDNDQLRWNGYDASGNKITFEHEPYASFWKRLAVNMMRILPIDSML